ncbi:unnamed protein product, partial [Rotaria sordida]
MTNQGLNALAYHNVRHLIQRQIPTVRRKLDYQLTTMIFVRVIFFIILLLSYTIFRTYSLNINVFDRKSSLCNYSINLNNCWIISVMESF